MEKKSKRAKQKSDKHPSGSGGGRGRNQTGLRDYNARWILSLIRRKGACAKAEIAVETGLSAQAVTVIINELEVEGLVIKRPPQRGRVGQPSVPFALNPDGAFAFGLKVGRRSFDLILLDFLGKVRGALHESCAYPTVDRLMRFLRKGIDTLTPGPAPELSPRILGLGVATPYDLWKWTRELDAPEDEMLRWRQFDFNREIAGFCSLPVYVCNDDTAACAAELIFGACGGYPNFLYLFIGSFVGGGVVLNQALVPGHRGNAGAVGSLPVPVIQPDGTLGSQQLIMKASLYVLGRMLAEAGLDASVIWDNSDYWGDLGPTLDAWIENVAEGLACAAVCAISLIDFEAIVIDGALPVSVRKQIVARTVEKVRKADLRGLSPVEIVEGSIGARAQSIGSASLPFIANFSQDSNRLFQNGIVMSVNPGVADS